MRSSSIKSLSIVAAFVVALAAAPRAEAKTTKPRVRTTLTQLISRYFGIRTQDDYPSEPIPKIQPTATTGTVKEEVSPVATTPQ